MPLTPRSSRGGYDRVYRRIHPYRVVTVNERRQRFQPILRTIREGDSLDQPPSGSPARADEMIKPTLFYVPYLPLVEFQEVPVTFSTYNLPSQEWVRVEYDSQWSQAEQPEIVITSDVQLQTDHNETGFGRSASIEVLSQTRLNDILATNHSDIHASRSNENTPELVGSYIHVETETYPPNNIVDNDISQHDENTQSNVRNSYSCPFKKVPVRQTAYNKSLRQHSQPNSMPVLPMPTISAREIASTMIKTAKKNKTLNVKAVQCLDCERLPVQPVTGVCGHTRCTKCIELNEDCRCGVKAPEELHVNIVIENLLAKLPTESPSREIVYQDSRSKVHKGSTSLPSANSDLSMGESLGRVRRYRTDRALMGLGPNVSPPVPMSLKLRFEYGRRLLFAGRYSDAAPHFARVAASASPRAWDARLLLQQIITVLAKEDPREDLGDLEDDLCRAVKLQAASSWLTAGDLECVLCFNPYTRPVTTPCGHTFCRTCIERTLDYRKACALCQRPLDNFDVFAARETIFLAATVHSINASRPLTPPDPDVIPIFVCTVAFPTIACPLFIFNPRYKLMVRRVLKSGSRLFGMVAYEEDGNYCEFGTVLEVCDCVYLEDGRSFISTIGVARFRIIESDVWDGCEMARIQLLADIIPSMEAIFDIRYLGSQISYRAEIWLNSMDQNLRAEIEAAFGATPRFDVQPDGWSGSPDGPTWLWWLIAILPLRTEIQLLILSTKNLMKRMMAVSRTLEAIDQASITMTDSSEREIRSALTNVEEWLERGF